MDQLRLYGRLPVFAQNVACTWAGWKRARERYGAHFRDSLGRFEESAKGSEEELRDIQVRRLGRMIERCRRHVPRYRALGLPAPAEAREPARAPSEMLAALPVLEKEELRTAPESFLAEDIPRERLHKGKTSGTTGSALPLWYTTEALQEEYAVVWRLRRSVGCGFGDPYLTFGGQLVVPFEQRDPPYWRRNYWGRQTLFSLYHMSEEMLPAYVDAIHRVPSRYVVGYPSSIHLVGVAMLKQGRPLPKGRLHAVFTSSESLLAFQREAIEEAFGAPVYDRYGTSELAVSMTQCARGRLHVDMEFCVVEVDVEERGDGWERGPLLVSGLANDGMPLLRYRIGDVGTRVTSGRCPCGRPGETFLDVDGRIEDYVSTPDGRLIGRLDHIFKDQRAVAEAQILQEDRDAVEVLVVPSGAWGPGEDESLRKEIRSRLGDEIRIDLRIVTSIPREPNGKFRAVKSSAGRKRFR